MSPGALTMSITATAAAARHARHLRGRARGLVDVVEREAADHDVELLVGKRQRGGVALDEHDVAASGGGAGREHRARQAEAARNPGPRGEVTADMTGPARHVEDDVVGTDRHV